MKRWTLVAVALIACAAITAGAATAAPSPAQLQRQIKALQRQVTTLQTKVASIAEAVEGEARCESVVPIAQYGGFDRQGYVYGFDDGAELFLTSALDVMPTTVGEDPESFVWMVVADNACVTTSSTSRVETGRYQPTSMSPVLRNQRDLDS